MQRYENFFNLASFLKNGVHYNQTINNVEVTEDAEYTAVYNSKEIVDIEIHGTWKNEGDYFTLTGENTQYSLNFQSKSDVWYIFKPGTYSADKIWNGSSITNKTTGEDIDGFDIREAVISRKSWYYTTKILFGKTGVDILYRITHYCYAPLNDYGTTSQWDDYGGVGKNYSVNIVNEDLSENNDTITYYVDDNNYYGVTLRFVVDKSKNGKIPSGVYPINISKEKGTAIAISNYSYSSDNKFYDNTYFDGSIAWEGYSLPYKKGYIGLLVSGNIEVVNINETYYMKITAINSRNVPINITVGTAPTYSVTATGEHGTFTGTGNFTHGGSTTVTAVADDDYRFVRWSDGNTKADTTFTNITSNISLTAIFESTLVPVNVKVLKTEHGIVSVGDYTATSETDEYITYSINMGTHVTVTANADTENHYEFKSWTDKSPVLTDGQFILTQDTIIGAVFGLEQYTVTITTPENGTITVKNGDDDVASGTALDYGTVLTVTATPATGYNFTEWAAGTPTLDQNNQFTLTSAVTIGASFEKIQYTITLSAATGQESYCHFLVNGEAYNPATKFDLGTKKVTVECVPENGYHFEQWSDYDEEEEETWYAKRTFTNLSGNISLTATLGKNKKLIIEDKPVPANDEEISATHTYFDGIWNENKNEQHLDIQFGGNSYSRTFSQNSWATFYFPFSLESLKGTVFEGCVHSLVGYEGDYTNLTLNFSPTDKVVAGRAYLVYMRSASVTNPTFYNVKLETMKADSFEVMTGLRMVGVDFPARVYHNNWTNIYISSNKLYFPNAASGVKMRAFRGYFNFDNTGKKSVAPRLRVVADGVETILEMDENQDLQEVETTRKYIENGILIIERGGVRYTAQGNKID